VAPPRRVIAPSEARPTLWARAAATARTLAACRGRRSGSWPSATTASMRGGCAAHDGGVPDGHGGANAQTSPRSVCGRCVAATGRGSGSRGALRVESSLERCGGRHEGVWRSSILLSPIYSLTTTHSTTNDSTRPLWVAWAQRREASDARAHAPERSSESGRRAAESWDDVAPFEGGAGAPADAAPPGRAAAAVGRRHERVEPGGGFPCGWRISTSGPGADGAARASWAIWGGGAALVSCARALRSSSPTRWWARSAARTKKSSPSVVADQQTRARLSGPCGARAWAGRAIMDRPVGRGMCEPEVTDRAVAPQAASGQALGGGRGRRHAWRLGARARRARGRDGRVRAGAGSRGAASADRGPWPWATAATAAERSARPSWCVLRPLA